MKMQPWERQIREVVELYRSDMLKANPEYQRGAVWSPSQKKKLIDSVMRGYPLPLIYLHYIKKGVAGMHMEALEIIDGQQRIIALYEFAEGAYKLFDPINDEAEAKFPNFVKQQPCPWGGKDFASLPDELREGFLNTPLAIARITTDSDHEARDLFIRLQAGLPLNAQENRDAWPGAFTEFILRIAGKPQLARYPGHEFFRRIMGMKPGGDRGKTRQLAAQIAMLFITRRLNGPASFIDINSRSIDDFYYTHIDFDLSSPDATRLRQILDKLEVLLSNQKRPKLRGHDAIHLVLLVDSLWDDYARNWEDRLAGALDRFLFGLALGKKTRDARNPDEFWTQYGQHTRVNSDRADRIALRHAFYVAKMFEFLGPLKLKDPKRNYGAVERELVYFRDEKFCQVCHGSVIWTDADVHHVEEHTKGGPTVLENGVLVHRVCHPKGDDARAFAADWRARQTSRDDGASK